MSSSESHYDSTPTGELPVVEESGPYLNRAVKVLVGGAAVVTAVCCFAAGSVFGGNKPSRNQGPDRSHEQPVVVATSPGELPASPLTQASNGQPTQSQSASGTLPSGGTSEKTPGPVAAPTAYSFDGRIIYGSDGRQYFIENGRRSHITNTAISACVRVRRHAGAPIAVSDGVVGSYPSSGLDAHCPYESQTVPGKLNFVTEDGQWVWFVDIENSKPVKHHAGSLCRNPNNTYALAAHIVPQGETAGHITGSDWFATDAECEALA